VRIKGCAILIVLTLVWLFASNFFGAGNHAGLEDSSKPGDVNHVLRQLNQPTREEKVDGQKALSRWKTASKAEKSRLADAIVKGRALFGLTQTEVFTLLGKPDAFGAPHDVGPHIEHTGYDVAVFGESQCDLLIDLKDGRVVDTYLDLNY